MGIITNFKDKFMGALDKIISKNTEGVPPEIGSLNPEEAEIQTEEKPGELNLSEEEIQEPVEENKKENIKEKNKQKAKRKEIKEEPKKRQKNTEKHFINEDEETNEEDSEETSRAQIKEKLVYDELLIRIEKINAVLDSFEAFKKFNSERIGQISEQIGELRGNIVNNERSVKAVETKATIASELVKEVQPEKLMTNLQKEIGRIDLLKTRLDGFESYNQTILEELKEVKSKMNIFRGTEEILKLQDNIKRDLIEIQKVKTIVQGHTDKVEEIFINIKNDVASFEKLNLIIKDLTTSFKDVKKSLEELRIKSENYTNKDELNKLKETVSTELLEFDNYLSSSKKEIDNIAKIDSSISKLVSLIRQNTEDIESIRQKLSYKLPEAEKQEILKKINDNSSRLENLLDIIDKLSSKVNEINKTSSQSKDIKKSLEELRIKSENYTNKDELNKLREITSLQLSEFGDSLRVLKRNFNNTKQKPEENSILLEKISSFTSLIRQNSNDIGELKQKYSTPNLENNNTFVIKKIQENSLRIHHLLNLVDKLSHKVDEVNKTNLNKLDEKTLFLLSYIKNSVSGGFTMDQIKNKVLESKWPVEVFLKAKNIYEKQYE